MSSSDRSQGQYRRMSDGGKSRASTPAGKDGGGDKTHAEDEESIPSRVSSAEVRRRKRAWHFGDIPVRFAWHFDNFYGRVILNRLGEGGAEDFPRCWPKLAHSSQLG